MRVVFDTNVLISALLSEKSKPAQALFSALQQGEVLMSALLTNEINRILHRKKFDHYLPGEQREIFLIALVQSTPLVEITKTIRMCHDPQDKMLLELALLGALFFYPCKTSPLRLSLSPGVVRSRRASRSSTPVAGRVAGRGGFDPHPLPPVLFHL